MSEHQDDIEYKSDGDPKVLSLLEEDDEFHCPECGVIADLVNFGEDGSDIAECPSGHSWTARTIEDYDGRRPDRDDLPIEERLQTEILDARLDISIATSRICDDTELALDQAHERLSNALCLLEEMLRDGVDDE